MYNLNDAEKKHICNCLEQVKTTIGQNEAIAMHTIMEALRELFNKGIEIGRREADGDKILKSIFNNPN